MVRGLFTQVAATQFRVCFVSRKIVATEWPVGSFMLWTYQRQGFWNIIGRQRGSSRVRYTEYLVPSPSPLPRSSSAITLDQPGSAGSGSDEIRWQLQA